MTALDKAFIKAYSPNHKPSPAAAYSAARPAPSPVGSSPESQPLAVQPQPVAKAPVTASPIYAEPAEEPVQERRIARAIGHAPSPLPAPHANFNGGAQRQRVRPSTPAATEIPIRNMGTPVILHRTKKPPEQPAAPAIAPPVAKSTPPKSREERPAKRVAKPTIRKPHTEPERTAEPPAPAMQDSRPGKKPKLKTAKAAAEQPPELAAAKRRAAKAEPPQEEAKPVVRSRKSIAAPAVPPPVVSTPIVSTPVASNPAVRPKRKKSKLKLRTAQRDEFAEQTVVVADSAPSPESSMPVDAVSIDAALELLAAGTESSNAPEVVIVEPQAAPVDDLPSSHHVQTHPAANADVDGLADNSVALTGSGEEPAAALASSNSVESDPYASETYASGPTEPASSSLEPQVSSLDTVAESVSTGDKAGPRTERRPLSEFVKQLPFEDAFHPHLEVDYFLWPTAVDSLVERGGPALEQFAVQLTTQAGAGEKVLAVSGGGRGEGRTSVILSVARRIAERGGRVVIVDADFEKPDLARYLGLAPEFGWDDVLQGDLPLEEVLITSLRDRVAIVPWHRRLSPGVLPFHPLRASISLNMLRDHYDLVLVDGGPLLSDGKPNGLASLVQAAQFDGSYLVGDCRPQAAGTLAEPLRMARNVGLRVFGAIENFSSLAHEASEPRRAAA